MTKMTNYLGLYYAELTNPLFAGDYSGALNKFDTYAFTYNRGRLKYPKERKATFTEMLFSITNATDFELVGGTSRYVQLGDVVHYEVSVKSKVGIGVGAGGDIGNRTIGKFNAGFEYWKGDNIRAINDISAAYFVDSAGTVQVTAFGGNQCGTTVPAGTTFTFAGSFLVYPIIDSSGAVG